MSFKCAAAVDQSTIIMAIAGGIGGVGMATASAIGVSIGLLLTPAPNAKPLIGLGFGVLFGSLIFGFSLNHYRNRLRLYYQGKYDSINQSIQSVLMNIELSYLLLNQFYSPLTF